MKKGRKAAGAKAGKPVAREPAYVADETSWKEFSGSDDDNASSSRSGRRGGAGDNDEEETVELHALANSDDETDEENLPQDSTRWDRIKAKKLAEVERQSKSWGRTREAYYDADNASDYNDSEQEEVERMEEQEAVKTQREQAKTLSEVDFGLADVLAAGKKGVSAASAGKKASASAAKAAAGALTKDEKIRQVIEDSPELLALLDEYTTRIKELRVEVAPLLTKAREVLALNPAARATSDLATRDGISFLELKHQLLVSYCVNLAFYLLLRAEGKSIASHPVVKRLVHIRVTLEKMRPVDRQLRYQVEKLLKAGAMTAAATAAAATATADAAAAAGGDMLNFKPSLSAMAATLASGKKATGAAGAKGKRARLSAAAAGSAMGGSDDEDSDLGAAAGPSRLMGASASASAAAFEDGERRDARARTEQERRARKAAGSRLVQELRAELSERPEEESTGAYRPARLDRFEKERREFEEEHYVRLADTKESRKRRNAAERIHAFDEFDDFADLQEIVHVEKRARADAERGARELADARARAGKRRARGGDSDDDDEENTAPRGRGRATAEPEFDDDDAAFYAKVHGAVESKRVDRIARQEAAAAAAAVESDDDVADDGERRHIGKKIMDNRGLARQKVKGDRGVRVMSRKRAHKAEQRSKSQVQRFNGSVADSYAGESRGIKKNTVRSHKFGK
jgi:U3 small nucleolar RNA-associated protein 3